MTVSCLTANKKVCTRTAHPCGKINLTLRILGRRADGFHQLHSLAVGVDLRDRLIIERSNMPGIRIVCPDVGLVNQDNLVVRACAALARQHGIEPALDIRLEKLLPMGGGMGGGSSDAAAALRACNCLWGLGLGDAEMAAVGAEIGSDVPLFFSLPVAEMSGRGEIVQPVSMAWSGWALLVLADTAVSTAAVYAALDADVSRLSSGEPFPHDGKPAVQKTHATPPDQAVAAIRAARKVQEFEHLLGNDLEPAVFRTAPAVAEVCRAINRAPFGPFRVSGAGSTLFRLFDDRETADQAAQHIAKLDLRVRRIVAAVPTGHSLFN